MLLLKDVKAKGAVFEFVGPPISGMYRVGQEMVALINYPSLNRGEVSVFYAFRGAQGTSAVFHGAGELVELVATGEML